MPQVTIAINGRPYAIACDAGEEERIRQLAKAIDARVSAFAKEAPQAGESRLLVMAALMLADELHDLREQGGQPDGGAPKSEPKAGRRLRGLAKRAEAVADQAEALPLAPPPETPPETGE